MSLALFDTSADQALKQVMQPTFVRGIIHLLLALYVVRLAPELPTRVTSIFNNQYVKLLIFALVLWTAQFSPSTAIMISLAFMVSVNYAMNKPLWEFLENEAAPTPASVPVEEAVQATAVLASAAASPGTLPVAEVQQAIEVLSASVTTQEGADAAMQLAQQAMTSSATSSQQVSTEVQTVMSSIQPAAPTQEPTLAPAETAAAVEAVKELAQAAAAPTAAPLAEVQAAAEIAMAAATTPEATEAIVKLAEQAMDSTATSQPMVEQEAVLAMASIPAVTEEKAKAEVSGCFPPRRFDLSNVVGYEPSLFELSA